MGGMPPGFGGIDDDDDDDGIPPEIKALMEMTEGVHHKAKGKKKKVERVDESKDDIMKRMNDLHDEIGDAHKDKYEEVNQGKDRVI
jgi:chromosome segregation ATPase